MDAMVFQVLGEPNRLRMIELLRERPHAVNEIADALGMPQPKVSRHLRTLNDAGIVRVYAIAQQRFYGLRPEPLREVDAWISSFQPFWDTRSSILDQYMRTHPGGTAPRTSSTGIAPVTIERVLDAPPTRVWDAWTDPARAMQWWGPDYFTTPRFELDVRPDGLLRIDIQAPDGTVFPMTGVVKEAVEPQGLVFITTPLDESGERLFEVLHTVELMDEDGKTRLRLEARVFFAGPDAAPYLAGMELGWQQSLAKLDRSLGGERPTKGTRRRRKHDGGRTR